MNFIFLFSFILGLSDYYFISVQKFSVYSEVKEDSHRCYSDILTDNRLLKEVLK